MVKARFTDEQITEILQQSKEGASNKELCEHYQFSISTLRRWQEQHAEGVRSDLKKIESKAQIVFLLFFAVSIILTLIFDKPTGGWVIPPLLIYCVYYIRLYRNISSRHIKKEDIYLSRSVNKSYSALYNLSWTFICFFIFVVIYFFVRIFS
ncbi:transposase [Escherichia coli]|uniref:transposase n=1 Tax=Escherichia coli TaxID=562 RepID=UPI003B971056